MSYVRSLPVFAAAALAASIVGAAPAAAQKATQFPTNDPVIQRIWRLGMDSSRVQQLSQTFFDSIGPRLTGSPGMRNASDWVIKTYKSWGIDARRENYGTWRGWRRGVSHIDLVAPRVRSLEGTMLGWSPGTHGTPVTASVIVLPKFKDSTAFVKWLPQARGKIVMVSPSWPTCRPSEDWYRWSTPAAMAHMDTLIAEMQQESAQNLRNIGYTLALGTGTLGMRLENAGVAGVLTSRPKLSGFPNPLDPSAGTGGRGRGGAPGTAGPGSMSGGSIAASVGGGRGGANAPLGTGGWGTIEIFETYNTKAPAIALSCEDYGLLYRLAENHQNPRLRLDLDGQLLGEQPVFNTIGEIKGTEKPDEYVMFSAHFDSWDGSSGATDNGTGTMLAMEAMRILKLAYPRPRRTILVGHWAAEEEGLIGSRAFTEDHPDVMRGLQALFNQDNGTGRIQSVSSQGLTATGPHLKAWYSLLPSFYTDSMSANAVSWRFTDAAPGAPGGTDGAVFTCKAAPSFAFGAVSWNYNSYTWHTNRDTYDKVVFDDLKHNATLAAMMAYAASEDPTFIARDKSPGEWVDCGKAPRKTNPRLR